VDHLPPPLSLRMLGDKPSHCYDASLGNKEPASPSLPPEPSARPSCSQAFLYSYLLKGPQVPLGGRWDQTV
jgi:hypothetical protein